MLCQEAAEVEWTVEAKGKAHVIHKVVEFFERRNYV
jgi:hypothetical protein